MVEKVEKKETMSGEEIGKVIHYFGKAMVAVVRLTSNLVVGDTVKIMRGEVEQEEKVESMQVDHQPVESGKAGDEVAIKINSPAKEGAIVYKIA